MSQFLGVCVYGLLNGLATIDMMLIMRLFFGMGTCKKRWQWIFFGVSFLVIHILMVAVPVGDGLLYTGLLYAHMISIAMILSPKRRFKALLCMIPALWIYIQFGMLVLMVEKLLPITATPILEGHTFSVLDISADVITMIFLMVAVRYFEKKDLLQPIKLGETIFMTAYCFISPVFVEIMQMLVDMRKSPFRNVVWVLCVLGVNVAVYYGIFYRRKARYYRMISKNSAEQFNLEYEYFKRYKDTQQETTKFRHDWKNHMLILQSMLEQEEYEKARKYFAKLSERRQFVSGQFVTGNEILDIILNAKYDVLKENKIHVECVGNFSGLKFMEDEDCCVLFSNLLDNAVEANLRCESERFIRIKADEHIGYLRIVMENAFAGEVIVEEEGIRTTKEEPGHGIGTRNAFAIIKKYQGEYEVRTEKQCFSLAIIYPKET